MKVTDLWKEKNKPTVSFELFPARNEKAAANLEKAIDKLAEEKPDFVSVTFGAGGSTREGSRELVEKLGQEKNLQVLAYVACFGLAPKTLSEVLDAYKALGVETVLAVRGDPPHGQEDFKPHPDSFVYASDFIKYIEPRGDFCVGCAGYPEGHIEAESRERDLDFLKLKIDNGADFVITNYTYDNAYYFDFVDRARRSGIEVPILPGVMPVYSIKMMNMLAELCGATITDDLKKRLAALPEGDKEALSNFGIEFAAEQCRGLIEGGAPGVHIYTMDRSTASVAIVNMLRGEGLL